MWSPQKRGSRFARENRFHLQAFSENNKHLVLLFLQLFLPSRSNNFGKKQGHAHFWEFQNLGRIVFHIGNVAKIKNWELFIHLINEVTGLVIKPKLSNSLVERSYKYQSKQINSANSRDPSSFAFSLPLWGIFREKLKQRSNAGRLLRWDSSIMGFQLSLNLIDLEIGLRLKLEPGAIKTK